MPPITTSSRGPWTVQGCRLFLNQSACIEVTLNGQTASLSFRFRAVSLVWNATCTDSFSPGNIAPSEPSSKAESRKRSKYAALAERHIFVPVSVETSGAMSPATVDFLRDIGRRMRATTLQASETTRLFQRVSIAIARGNAFSILQCSPSFNSHL